MPRRVAGRLEPCDLGHLSRIESPCRRCHVLPDLVPRAGAGDDGGDLGLAEQPSQGKLEKGVSVFDGESLEPFQAFEVWRTQHLLSPRAGLEAGACGGAPGAVLPGQEAGFKRVERDYPQSEAPGHLEDLGLDAPRQQAVLVLGGYRAGEMELVGGPGGVDDLPGAEVAVADVPHLALADQ